MTAASEIGAGRAIAIRLAELEFNKRAEVLHFLGPPGTGKCHLATAIGVAAVRAGRSVYRCSLADMIEALTKAELVWRLTEKIRFYARASLLIVDEIGYLRADGREVAESGQRP